MLTLLNEKLDTGSVIKKKDDTAAERNKNYNGGKNGSGMYQQIISLIPGHDIYFELFAGSASIYYNKIPAAISFLMDKDHGVISSHKQLLLHGDNLICGDAISFIENAGHILNFLVTVGFSPFMYLDPPYPFSVRRSDKKLYKHEMSDTDHHRLLSAVLSLDFPVMISSYKNKMYDEILKNWFTYQFQVASRQGKRTEILYMNYPMPDQLHDYRYIGKSFRERERFKLIRQNTVAKINRLPAVLKNAIKNDLNN